MNILDKILAAKLIEVRERQIVVPVSVLEASEYFKRKCHSLVEALSCQGSSGIIAEFKRKSPSKGEFAAKVSVQSVCPAYQSAGAAALSILTDCDFFGGSLEDIRQVRKLVNLPILRKDFVVDEYQILEAKAAGADVVLLIAAALSAEQCRRLAIFARALGLEVLLEVHNKEELRNYCSDSVNLLGVNNRDLRTFKTDLAVSAELQQDIPQGITAVSESGLNCAADVLRLRACGYKGFLIGERFMSSADPARACSDFIGELKC